MGTHIDNVLMQQSTGLKSNMPNARPVAELLVVLNEFNKYELYTGTGDGTQPLYGDGTGSSNVSFELTQNNANTISGKFVYFDSASGEWKSAYAQANPTANEHFTAQGFAVSSNTSDVQVTTSGKLIIPFRLKDYTGTPVVPGSYYYLCQDQANAGMIQQSAPASGIMQIVCQIIAADDNSTTMLLLNDLNQVADDIIQTDGDGSRYLGDDGQYHNMQIAGLAGRTSNCLDQYEILDIDFQNIDIGENSFGYIPIGDVTIENNVASNFSENNYIISKYMVENETQYSFVVKQTFTQTTGTEPIWSAPNNNNYLAIDNKELKLVLNGIAFKGSEIFEPGTYYFKITYNKDTGYIVSTSTDNASWSNQIALYDEINYLDKLTMYLGIVRTKDIATVATGSIDLSESGFTYKNNTEVTDNFPLSNLTNKKVATITVTAKATGLIASGRAKATGTLQAISEDIDTSKNTIIASDKDTLVWDKTNGLTMTNYEEIDYLRNYEGTDNDTTVYAKDTNLCYKYTIIYPNFLEVGTTPVKDEDNYIYNFENINGVSVLLDDNNNIVAEGWDRAKFLRLQQPINFGNKPWEFRTQFYYTGTTAKRIIDSAVATVNDSKSIKTSIAIGIDNATLKLWLSSNNSNEHYDIVNGVTAAQALTAGTVYALRLRFTGTQYLLDVSTTGTSWTNYITVDSEKPVNSDNCLILGSNTAGAFFVGRIDLGRTYFNVEGTRVWSAIEPNLTKNDYKIDFKASNAAFHPNTFLNRNGFDFNLKLDLKGNLKLYRELDATKYGGNLKIYNGIQGCDWSTFINDGNYAQGVKISSYLGTNNIGTGNNSLYQLTTNENKYWWMTNTAANIPSIAYFNFEKPIRFSSVGLRNAGSANYMPQTFAIHVSNDLNTWFNVLPESSPGFAKNGMMGNLPIDAFATWPNTTINSYITQKTYMPDDSTYYKYVRLCLWQSTAYQPEISGFFIGCNWAGGTTVATSEQTATELILDKENFINEGTSGINASVVRKKIGEVYQVKFLDRLGWTSVSPENAVIDSEGKKLLPNEELVYHDPQQKYEIAQQTLAYQTHCKQYLTVEKENSLPYASNPFMNITEGALEYTGCANTGTVANSYCLLQTTGTVYDFNNSTNESSYIITMMNRARVNFFTIVNHSEINYTPQQIRIYGSVNGGSVENTIAKSAIAPVTPAEEAIWEEIPIISIIPGQVVSAGVDPWSKYRPTESQLSFVQTANMTNALTSSVPTVGANIGVSLITIVPKKAYIQYKVVVQRTLNNKVVLAQIHPYSINYDPWATPLDSENNLTPLVIDRSYKLSSSATTLPNKSSVDDCIFTSPYSPSTVYNLYDGGNANWTPGNNRKFVYVQQAFKYPICLSMLTLTHGADLNYAANLMEIYGTNYSQYATQALSNTNSLKNWTRLVSLNEKCDMPTAISVASKNLHITFGRQEYGYSYFSYLFARTLNNSIYMEYLTPTCNNINSFVANTVLPSASCYTQEWKWTNVKGIAGEVRNDAVYNHPLLQLGDTHSLTPSYAVTKREDDYTYYTETQGVKNDYLPNGTGVYNNTSKVMHRTLPYENRWMYKFIDIEGNNWYSPSAPSANNTAVLGAKMYKNIIPWFNKEVYTGIPLTATANTGSANGFTYFASGENVNSSDGYAWMAFCNTTNQNVGSWSDDNVYDATTGLPTGETPYVGFISPKPLTVNGYTIGFTERPDGGTALTGLIKWEFQGSNDGVTWATLDTRDTAKETNPDIPINIQAGSTYYFENETPYTQFRWVINQIEPGVTFVRLACRGLFVLEENPIEVKSIFELSYTNSNNETIKAYTETQGNTGDFVDNNIIIYKDLKLSDPLENEWAYSVTYGENTFYVKTPGEIDTFVPEGTTLYTDKDFINAFETPALVDTWKYTGNIEKKFSYTGNQINDFTWDGLEPYNKYFYTGEIANQYKYTGKIEGWQYTGVKEDLYDTVPNFKLTLNRDNARKIVKQTYIGPAYPVTSEADPSGTTYYSFTSGDIAGTIVPEGTLLYSNLTDTESVATADGSSTYIFSSAVMQTRYNNEYLYVKDTDESEGSPVIAGTEAFYDADLTQPADVDVTQFTYTKDSEQSKITDFYHRITETTPEQSYNFGLSFNGNTYTFNSYAEGASSTAQTYESNELIKHSYDGIDESLKNHSVILMKSQDILKLDLSKSLYSWWEWNNVSSPETQRVIAEIFRLGKVDGVATSIDEIYKLFPWRVDDASTTNATEIGDPIFTLSNELKRNEIWLEGQLLQISKFKKLFKKYGTTWGGDGVETFGVPDFRDRAIWGSTKIGYVEGAIPNISASTVNSGAHSHNRGSMEIRGWFTVVANGALKSFYNYHVDNKVFTTSRHDLEAYHDSRHGDIAGGTVNFTASKNWTGATSQHNGHTHNVTLTKSSLYKDVSYVQPTSVALRVKTIYK